LFSIVLTAVVAATIPSAKEMEDRFEPTVGHAMGERNELVPIELLLA
jgi:hypothetical protein